MCGLFAAASRVVEADVAEYYSPGWYSSSSAEAARRGVLVRRPVIEADSLTYEGAPVRVSDAWIEQVTHVEYPWYLWRREVRDPALRLIVIGARDHVPPGRFCDEGLTDGYTERFASSGTSDRPVWYSVRRAGSDPPFPDTLRLAIIPHAGACRRPAQH